ncbi:MFS transporter [Nonomuraea africana]|uniref:MFS transporter n=1 Tax=Nonomuraea africana TaxID=46171 RepID=UPI003410E115
MSIYLVWGAVPSVLLALQVQRSLGEEDKAANLAVITTVGALVSVITQPMAGAISDRTRSRYGRRAPWLVLGGLVGGLSLIGMALGSTLAHFVIAWVCVQIGFNLAQGPLSAVMPDRVPRSVRGTFAAALGVGGMLGSLGGQIYAASREHPAGLHAARRSRDRRPHPLRRLQSRPVERGRLGGAALAA